jgi:hypothetical protein
MDIYMGGAKVRQTLANGGGIQVLLWCRLSGSPCDYI